MGRDLMVPFCDQPFILRLTNAYYGDIIYSNGYMSISSRKGGTYVVSDGIF